VVPELTGGGAEARVLAQRVSHAWIAFARSGAPNTPKLPTWTAFEKQKRATMVINNESKLTNNPFGGRLNAMYRVLDLA
jgi:para-nitrobenzyl esterase